MELVVFEIEKGKKKLVLFSFLAFFASFTVPPAAQMHEEDSVIALAPVVTALGETGERE